MAISKSTKKNSNAGTKDGWRIPMTAVELFTLSDEERIRRMSDMTPEKACELAREAIRLTQQSN